jgi:hypothetical protein
MRSTQKILFDSALEKLNEIAAKQEIVSGRCLFPESEKYDNWAQVLDESRENLKEAIRILKFIRDDD